MDYGEEKDCFVHDWNNVGGLQRVIGVFSSFWDNGEFCNFRRMEKGGANRKETVGTRNWQTTSLGKA